MRRSKVAPEGKVSHEGESNDFFVELRDYHRLLSEARAVAEEAKAGIVARGEVGTHTVAVARQQAAKLALQEHRRRCECHPAYQAFCADEAYQRAWSELHDKELRKVHEIDEAQLWWFDVQRVITAGLITLCLMRESHRRRTMFFTKRSLKQAEVVATELLDLLSITQGLHELPGAGLDRGWWPRFPDDLALTIEALRRVQKKPGRLPRATIDAAERQTLDAWCLVGACVYNRDFDEHVRRAQKIVTALCDMAGIHLHRTTIADAVHQHLKLVRPDRMRRRT